MSNLRAIGNACKKVRKSKGITQKDLGAIMGYSDKAISAFETGNSNNALILIWYIVNGLPVDVLRGVIKWQGNA